MPGPYTGTPKGLFFYGSIQGAAAQGATTSAVWEAMQEAALNAAAALSGFIVGSAIPPVAVLQLAAGFLQGVNIQDVNQMRAIAGQNIRASQTFAAAPANYAIDSSMIGIPPALGTGPGTGLPQKQNLHVHWNGLDEEGNPVDGWYTIYDVDVSGTVGDLRNLAETDANERIATRTKTPQAASITNVDRIDLLFT